MRTASGAPGSTGRGAVALGRVEQRSHGCEVTRGARQVPCSSEHRERHRRTVSVGAIGLGAMPLSTKEDRPSPDGRRAHRARRPRRGRDADRHRRRLRPGRVGVRAQRGAGRLGRCAPVRRHVRRCSWRPRAGTRASGTDWELDGSPAYLRRACEASLRRLGVDAIGLYQFHRPDPATPWEESMGGLRALYDDGLVRMVGISNAVGRRRSTRPARSSATRWSACRTSSRRAGARRASELAHCASLGLAWLPWSPFGGVSRGRLARRVGAGVRRGGRRSSASRCTR